AWCFRPSWTRSRLGCPISGKESAESSRYGCYSCYHCYGRNPCPGGTTRAPPTRTVALARRRSECWRFFDFGLITDQGSFRAETFGRQLKPPHNVPQGERSTRDSPIFLDGDAHPLERCTAEDRASENYWVCKIGSRHSLSRRRLHERALARDS